jgi:hypothetical protein
MPLFGLSQINGPDPQRPMISSGLSGEPVMTLDQDVRTVREAVGVFSSPETLQAAIDELMSSGFDRADLSLLAAEKVVDDKLGHKYQKVAELEHDAEVPRQAYVSTESVGDAQGALIGGLMYIGATAAAGAIVASGGTLAAVVAAAAAAGGAGGLLGSALAETVGERHARHLQEQLEHGGLLLWARTWNPDDEKLAVEVMRRHSGQDVHVHSVAA